MKSSTLYTFARVMHLLCLALWAGGAIFFSFLVAPRIFAYLGDRLPASPPPGGSGITVDVGRRLAGDTVGAIFPVYFVAQIVLGVVAVGSGGYLASRAPRGPRIRLLLVAAAFVLVTLHALTIYPHSTQVLDQHYQAADAGDASRAAELRKTFGMLHGISQALNLATIGLISAALVLIGCEQWTPGRNMHE